MVKQYTAVYIVTVRLHHPIYGPLGNLFDPIRHWKIWMHSDTGEDSFVHLHKMNDLAGHISLQMDQGWVEEERLFVETHRNSLLFLGLTKQSADDVAVVGKFSWTHLTDLN